MAVVEVKCPNCGGTNVVKNGKSPRGAQRYNCRNELCDRKYFILDYAYTGSKPGINEQIIKMASNASGIRDTARVLGITTDKVMDTLKNKNGYKPNKLQLYRQHGCKQFGC